MTGSDQVLGAPTVPVAAEPMLEYARRLPRKIRGGRLGWLTCERFALLAGLIAACCQAVLKVFDRLDSTGFLDVAHRNRLLEAALGLVVMVCVIAALALPIGGVLLGVYALRPRGKHKLTAVVAVVLNALLFLNILRWIGAMLE